MSGNRHHRHYSPLNPRLLPICLNLQPLLLSGTRIARLRILIGFTLPFILLIVACILYTEHIEVPNAIYIFAFCLPMAALILIPILWKVNTQYLARFDSLAIVGPLLDVASFALRRNTVVRTSEQVWAEAVVLRHLPSLLDRMASGDGPRLTDEQRATLRWLVNMPDYYTYFIRPGLNDKIDAILHQGAAKIRTPI